MRNSPKKIAVLTLGCSKNTTDSESLLAQFKASSGFEICSPDIADILIINTCGFIEDAKQESINTILDAVGLKKNGPLKKVYVMGCLSERYKSDLETEMPEVDGYFGVQDLPNILNSVGALYREDLLGERELLTPKHYAYLKISEGCDHPCSFCAIPLIRGKFRSKPMTDILSEAKRLKEKDVKELNLIAQDTTYYGSDLYGKKTLADLLCRLSDLDFTWIRLLYTYPSQFPLDILPVIQERENICNYLDLPLQHIHDDMLRSMKRGITKRQTLELIERIRNEIPDIRLRSTFIVGYPNETEAIFEELCRFVEETKFDRLGCFTYSHEEDTPAFELPDNVSPIKKTERQETLMGIQEVISAQKNQAMIGSTIRVLIDRFEGDFAIGRTEFDAPDVDNEVLIKVNKDHRIEAGQFYNTKIIDSEPFDLIGQIVDKS